MAHRRRKITEVTAENDIKYRGPLSYRYLRIIGWLLLIGMQIGVFLGILAKVQPGNAATYDKVKDTIGMFTGLTLPLFLLANFSFMFRTRTNGYKKLLMNYGFGALGLIALFLLITEHYALSFIMKGGKSFIEAQHTLDALIKAIFENGISLNVFIDLFLCTLFFFFVNYRPKKHFQGKKLIIFRLFSLFPVLYELLSIVLKGLNLANVITLPSFLYPLLTNKPFMTFVAFIVIVFVIKYREKYFIKRGKTHAEYEAFLQTNRNSFDISVAISIIFVAAAVLDVISWLGLSLIINGVEYPIVYTYNLGFGQSTCLILSIPFVLLFSYTREHKNTKLDSFIPLIGVALIAFTYIEGIFLALLLA